MTRLPGLIVLALIGVGVAGGSLWALDRLRTARDAALAQNAALLRDIARIEDRIAVMAMAGRAQGVPDATAIAADDALAAELALQDRLLDLLDAEGIVPLNFGPGTGPDDTTLPTVGFEMEFETGNDAALSVIQAIELAQPPLALRDLSIRQLPTGSLGDTPTPVAVRLSIWSFWQDPDV